MRLRLTLKSTRTAARKRAQGFPRPGVRKIAEQFQVDPSTVQKISARVIFADL
jgi:DNA-binding transcriptional regulator YhcF (GntR family)